MDRALAEDLEVTHSVRGAASEHRAASQRAPRPQRRGKRHRGRSPESVRSRLQSLRAVHLCPSQTV